MTPRGEDRLIKQAIKALEAGDPQPVINLAARSILPTDAPIVAEAWAMTGPGAANRSGRIAQWDDEVLA